MGLLASEGERTSSLRPLSRLINLRLLCNKARDGGREVSRAQRAMESFNGWVGVEGVEEEWGGFTLPEGGVNSLKRLELAAKLKPHSLGWAVSALHASLLSLQGEGVEAMVRGGGVKVLVPLLESEPPPTCEASLRLLAHLAAVSPQVNVAITVGVRARVRIRVRVRGRLSGSGSGSGLGLGLGLGLAKV